MSKRPTLTTIQEAARRIEGFVVHTPVMRCPHLEQTLGAEIFLKCENFQTMGAFKQRGACNAVLSLDDDAIRRGVATHSSGNHGAALALAASRRHVPAFVVMPQDSARVKIEAVERYGATVIECGTGLASREETLDKVLDETGATLVHPYNDYAVIAGQGTAALELLSEVPDLDLLVAPVGGGGLMSGCAIAAKGLRPGIRLVGAEPSGADDAFRSLRGGKLIQQQTPNTVADGLRACLGDKTFAIIQDLIDDIVLVEEQEIATATGYVLEHMKILIEPSAGVAVAPLRDGTVDVRGKRVGVILTGGNVDRETLIQMLQADQD